MKARALSLFLWMFVLATAAFGQDVQMNAVDHNTGTKDNSTTQSETNHAVTPNGIIGAWNDSSQIATSGTMYTSLVGWRDSTTGASFSGGGFLTYSGDVPCWGDPAVVADSSGFLYLAGLVEDYQGIGIAKTTGTMPPYSFAAGQILAPPAGGELDKELMAIDRTGGMFNNRIYLVVADLANSRIVEAHSTSLSPLTFTAFQNISPSGSVTAPMPAVAPNGDVYVVWIRNGTTYEIVRSTNGGGAWANPDAGDAAAAKVIATVANASPGFLATVGNAIKIRAFPQIAIDSTAPGSPTRGNIYVAWHADPDAAGADLADIYFTRSTNNGVTWSAPRSITTGLAATIGRDLTTNDSFNPSIAVSPVNGHIYITFWDRREDTTAADGDAANTKGRVYRALSTDAGQTWNVIPFGTSTFVPIAGFGQAGASNNYWSEYNWSTSNANGLQFTWGDSRNTCMPPMGAMNPCSPSGRADLDSYYRTVTNLSGPDLYIKPWGAVTGEGPTWQTPYIYVVNAMDVQVNALKGIVNNLRARVRNLGNAASNNVVVRFKYAPWYAGINDAALKEIGTVNVNFSAAGGGMDDQVVPIPWDLTDLTDTNGGVWPGPIDDFTHFCMKVSVEPATDINLSNNVAQNNFFDVGTSSAPNSPMSFMIAGPDPRERGNDRPAFAQIVVSKLPPRFSAKVTVDGVPNASRGFTLKPNELRRATVRFNAPRDFKAEADVIADITLLLDGKPNGGISARLYDSPFDKTPPDTIGKTTEPYWEVRPKDTTEQIRGEEGVKYVPPPMRTIPKKVRFRETIPVPYERAFVIVQNALRSIGFNIALADPERGLFNTTGRTASRDEIARLVEASRVRPQSNGFYWLSVWLQPSEKGTEIGVDAWIATSDIEAPMGRRFRSNGTLERRVLDAIRRQLATAQ